MAAPSQRSPQEYFCADILRLPPGVTDPDHYTLLGVKYFEPDHGTIVRAAMQRLQLLESCQADPRPGHVKVLNGLIARVRQAQMTLLDAKRRKAYDATLTGPDDEPKEEKEVDDEIELRPGTMVVGRYRILGERRKGGFGIVFNALDSNMRTRVELSVLRPRLSEHRRSRRRAERAARAAAALDHPNILRVDEVGDADGLLFTRTRQIEGKNLVETIEATERMRLDPQQVRDIVHQIAEGLEYVHAREETHGDLRPHNVFLNAEGRVLLADLRVSRTIMNELGVEPPRTRAPEGEDSPAADLFSLGCLAYQMLAGMPPFPADSRHYVPRPLPDDVPEDLEVLVTRLLARDPDQRPAGAGEVVERLTPRAARKRLPLLIGAAAVLVIGLVVTLIATGGDDNGAGDTVRAKAWRLIAEQRFDEAIESLRAARRDNPADASLASPLAGALDRKAATLTDDPWTAQTLLLEAQELAPQPEREPEIERVRGACLAILEQVPVKLAPFVQTPVVVAEVGEGFSGKVEIAGQEVPVRQGIARRELQLFDGPHEVAFLLTDRVGNRREGKIATIVDATAPKLAIDAPKDGQSFANGNLRVAVSVEDANLPESVTIRGRSARIRDGKAIETFPLPDGKHTIEALLVDRAGNEARASVTVTVDSSIPDLKLAVDRVVTNGDEVTIQGTVGTPGASVRVDGNAVELDETGAFRAVVPARRDRRVPVEATGATGLKKKLSVDVVRDTEAPKVGVHWPRRDRRGALLYGTKEMDAGGLRLRVRVKDKTNVKLVPKKGVIDGDHWVVDAFEGASAVTLEAVDQAGNVATLVLNIDGHRATPALTVKNTTEAYTKDEDITLDVEADGDVTVNGKARPPGKIKLPLPEGKQVFVVKVEDRYGNASVWRKEIHVDRTAPEIKLAGSLERGVGSQELRFDANEELATLTCFGKTNDVNGRTARLTADLMKPGRRRLTVVAKDRAGNAAKTTFNLQVINKVLLLDGKSAIWVNMPRVSLNEFTIECWVRGTEAEGKSVLLSRSGRRSGFGLFWSREDKGLPYAALVVQENGFVSLPARKAWKWDRWTHLALSFDGQRARFYVNGSPHHSVTTRNPLLSGTAPLLVGAGPDTRNRPRYNFSGAVDEVRLSKVARYPRAFSPARYHKRDADTVVLLRFDTMADDKFEDTSGNRMHGQRIGSPQLVQENR